MRKFQTRFLDLAIYWAAHHTRTVYLGAIALVALVIWRGITSFPGLQTDILALLPSREPEVMHFKEAVRDFENLDYLLVMVRSRDTGAASLEEVQDFAEALTEAMRADEGTESVEANLREYLPFAEKLAPYALAYLSSASIEEIVLRVSDPAILREQMRINRQMLTTVGATGGVKDLLTLDPYGVSPSLMQELMPENGRFRGHFQDGWMVNEASDAVLLVVKPKRPSTDLRFTRAYLARLGEAERGAREASLSPEASTALEVVWGGGYPVTLADKELITHDFIWNTASTLVVVTLLFLLAFRRISSLFYAWLPLGLGLVLAFGTILITGIRMDSATAGAGALLIGLGIDYTIVMYGRFCLDRSRGMELDRAIVHTVHGSGKAVIIGALTTTATFLALFVTRFDSMRTLGLVTGLGILCVMLGALLLLPAMLHTHQRIKDRRGEEPRFRMHALGLEKVVRVAWRWPRTTLAVVGLSMIPAFWLAPRIPFIDNVDDMRAPDNRGVLASREISRQFGATSHTMMVVIEAPDTETLLQRNEILHEALKPLLSDGRISGVEGLGRFLPSAARQQGALDLLAAKRAEGILEPAHLAAVFSSAASEAGFRPEALERGRALMERALSLARPITPEALEEAGLGGALHRFLKREPGRVRSVTYLHIGAEYKRQPPAGLESLVANQVPGATLSGMNMVSRRVRSMIREDVYRSGLLGLVAVFLLVLLDDRHVLRAFWALVPFIVGLFWLAILMALGHQPLNLMNIFVGSMLAGIGVDYGLHMMHRFYEHDDTGCGELEDTGRAVILAALTTCAGFGSLGASSYPGLRTIGMASLFGTISCLVATLLVLPAAFRLVRDRRAAP